MLTPPESLACDPTCDVPMPPARFSQRAHQAGGQPISQLMAQALANVDGLVKPGGRLFIALYNDEGFKSRMWTRIKKLYCSSAPGRWAVKAAFLPLFTAMALAKCVTTGSNYFADYKRRRGMSVYHDWIDWLGGYPFEVAKPEEILEFYRARGYTLDNLRTTNRLGCNQFVFVKK